MLRLLRTKRGQSIMEYALMITIVIGAFSAMQYYIRRGLNAKIKEGTDNLPALVQGQAQAGGLTGNIFGGETQYEPYYMAKGSSNFTTNASSGFETGLQDLQGGKVVAANQTSSRTGEQTIVGANEAD